jgi:hypothetical protein
MRDLDQTPLNDPIFRYVPFDEEVAERDPEAQESFADVRPLAEVEAMRARWAQQFDEVRHETAK